MPVYNINGAAYVPLVSLCQQHGISWDYDPFSRTVNLSKSGHKASFMPGETLVLLDGIPQRLKQPVEIYNGIMVVPSKLKDELLKGLSGKEEPYMLSAEPPAPVSKIVIDAGHGGRDPGALGRSGLKEKIVTLDLAKRLRSLLIFEGFEVIMTRSTDTFVSLERRVEIANDSGADLFVSIHANANRARAVKGFEVYCIPASMEGDLSRAMQAVRDKAYLPLDSSCFAGSSEDLKIVLWDMVYSRNRAEAVKLAGSICRVMGANMDSQILGIKNANFHVLRGSRMPAVLIEVGFISNASEELKLRNGHYRQQVAEAVKDGIQGYARKIKLAEVSE